MTEYVTLDEDKQELFDDMLAAMSGFRTAFGKDASKDFIAELHVAKRLGLQVSVGSNTPGYDAVSPNNELYQVKYRADNTLNVDMNNF